MTAGWVAAVTRGRMVARHMVGRDGARQLAVQPDWETARRELATTVYGRALAPAESRHDALRTATEATLWQLRVMAGWLPPGASALARLFAAPMEIANIENHLLALPGGAPPPPYRLGSLAVAWQAVARAGSVDEVRAVLARSVWGDPGSIDPADIALALHVALARRAAARIPVARAWARGSAAVLAARTVFAFQRSIGEPTARTIDRLIGAHWRRAGDLDGFVATLPPPAAWPFTHVSDPDDLWRAELAVVARIGGDSATLASAGRYDASTAAGLMALFLVDLWRVRAAIEVAGRAPLPREVFDAVA